MQAGEGLRGLKARLDIDDDVKSFDSRLGQFLEDAVQRLSPPIYEEVDPQEITDFTVSSAGLVALDLSALTTPLADVRSVDLHYSADEFTSADSYRLHGQTLRIREVESNVTSIKVYGLATLTLSTVPSYLKVAVYWYAMSDFYLYLLSNRAQYNVYMANGRTGVDDMRELAEFFEAKASQYVDEKATVYGR